MGEQDIMVVVEVRRLHTQVDLPPLVVEVEDHHSQQAQLLLLQLLLGH